MTREGWGVGKLTLALYPFGAGAAAVNLFLAGLITPKVGLPAMTPGWAIAGGAILGLPITWLFARHIRTLMDRADSGPQDT